MSAPCRLTPALIALIIAPAAFAQAPNGYYANAEGLEGEALRGGLHEVIVNQIVLPYSSRRRMDVHDAIDVMDEDPGSLAHVNLLYSDARALKTSWPAYNREHVWPQSLGAREGSPAHTDLHHIFACDANVNSSRGNQTFDDCEDGDCRSHREAPDAFYAGGDWEPPDEDKGDVARALLYLDVRYEGDLDGEPDLMLVDEGVEAGCDCMGQLKTLLRWHELDPPDAGERSRQEMVFKLQGNRNPFIDHPEWVSQIWPIDAPIRVRRPRLDILPWISEIHYDNSGRDRDEGVEISGPADLSLAGWKLVFYDGRTARAYREVHLRGHIDDELKGLGARWFSIQRIQNGGADGVALVDPDGAVIEFFSYEGVVHPIGGPASGLASVEIDGEESSRTPVGHSLKRSFHWFDRWQTDVASPGVLNLDL